MQGEQGKSRGTFFLEDKLKVLPCPEASRPAPASPGFSRFLLLPSGGPCENAIVVVPGTAIQSPVASVLGFFLHSLPLMCFTVSLSSLTLVMLEYICLVTELF